MSQGLPESLSLRCAPKYDRLAEIAGEYSVPPMMLLDFGGLSKLLSNLSQVLVKLNAITEEIAQTRACFLERHLAEIRATLDTLEIAPDGEDQIGSLLAEGFGPRWSRCAFAVRSAATSEDLDGRSFAGLYETELNVKGVRDILTAVLRVWRSGFNRAAILERLFAGRLVGGNPMSVIVQEMVAADQAGVAFSMDPITGRSDIVVEAVAGTGESLVDGRARVERRSISRGALDGNNGLFERVAALCLSIEVRFGAPIDIEWAAVGEHIWLLQLRPITAGHSDAVRTEGPVADWTDLYGDDTTYLDRLGPFPEFARYFRAKRKRIHDFGRRNALAHSTALAVRANRLGLETRISDQLFASFTSDELVLDLNDSLRQVILPREEARARICRMMSDPHREHRFVLRDFVRGAVGLISERLNDHGIFAEWSADGLLAINRGTARTSVFRIAPDGRMLGNRPPLPDDLIEQLRRATLDAQNEIGPIRIEWVAGPNGLLAVDFSDTGAGQAQPASLDEIVSHGYARAPLFKIHPSEALTAMSIAAAVSLNKIPAAEEMGSWCTGLIRQATESGAMPIVVVDRPYAALAALIPHVSGFVFESASILCHLAILLRENGCPAIQSTDIYRAAASEEGLVEIDTHSGVFRLMKPDDTHRITQ